MVVVVGGGGGVVMAVVMLVVVVCGRGHGGCGRGGGSRGDCGCGGYRKISMKTSQMYVQFILADLH